MLNIGDNVKVNGTTMCGGVEKECIPVGTVCRVVGRYKDENGLTVGIIPVNELPYKGEGEYWYLERDVEKGHFERIKDT